jgi:hypothetical protein
MALRAGRRAPTDAPVEQARHAHPRLEPRAQTAARLSWWPPSCARRGGELMNLDQARCCGANPLARGWNTYLKAVRTELPTDRRKLRELAICTVAAADRRAVRIPPPRARLPGRRRHPRRAGRAGARGGAATPASRGTGRRAGRAGAAWSIRYAAQMTLDVRVDEDTLFEALRRPLRQHRVWSS